MLNLLKNFWKEEEGQDLVEYALLIGGIALLCLGAVNGLATSLGTKYEDIGSTVESGMAPTAGS